MGSSDGSYYGAGDEDWNFDEDQCLWDAYDTGPDLLDPDETMPRPRVIAMDPFASLEEYYETQPNNASSPNNSQRYPYIPSSRANNPPFTSTLRSIHNSYGAPGDNITTHSSTEEDLPHPNQENVKAFSNLADGLDELSTSQQEDQECHICTDVYYTSRMKTELSSCVHTFCYRCITEWAKRENTCPLCKRRFEQLRKVGARRWRKVCSNNQDEMESSPSEDGSFIVSDSAPIYEYEDDLLCLECGGAGDLDGFVRCPRCLGQFHVWCMHLHDTPGQPTYCHSCHHHTQLPGRLRRDRRLAALLTESPVRTPTQRPPPRSRQRRRRRRRLQAQGA